MEDVNPQKLREFRTWLSLLSNRSLPDRHKWKAWFCVARYEKSDYASLASTLEKYDSTASFAFLGRDVHEEAETIKMLENAGQEIVFHSHRHHTYADLCYEEAHDAITTGLEAFEDAVSISPDGFFVPFFELSDGSIRAIEDLGFDWILAKTEQNIAGVTVRDPAWPLDTKRFETQTVEQTMEQIQQEAAAGEDTFLFHPPVIEYYDGMVNFESWIREVKPMSIAQKQQRDEIGMVLDCVRPVSVE